MSIASLRVSAWTRGSMLLPAGALLLLAYTTPSFGHPPESEPVIVDVPRGAVFDMNASGTVVGNRVDGDPIRAFAWSAKSGLLDLHFGDGNTSAEAINDCGEVAGSAAIAGSVHAVRWSADGEAEDLGTLGGKTSSAMGINERGDVVGSSETREPGVVHAFLWTEADGMRDLGSLGGDQSAAFGVNNLRQVVGNSETAGRAQRPFLWTRRSGMLDLAPNSDQAGNAVAINDFGVVAGNLQGRGVEAFRWTRWSGLTRLKNLGGTIGLANDINDFGVIVGVSRNANDISHAAVWIGREPIDIDPGIGGLFSDGRAITNRGLVAGLVQYDNIGTFDAVIWNPAQRPFAASVGKRTLCQRRPH